MYIVHVLRIVVYRFADYHGLARRAAGERQNFLAIRLYYTVQQWTIYGYDMNFLGYYKRLFPKSTLTASAATMCLTNEEQSLPKLHNIESVCHY